MVTTPGDSVARVDALMVDKHDRLAGLLEVKTREQKYDTYLISRAKLDDGKKLSEFMQVPFVLAVGYVNLGEIWTWRITDTRGEWASGSAPDTRWTRTQTTCNGGEIERANAFLPFNQAKKWSWPI